MKFFKPLLLLFIALIFCFPINLIHAQNVRAIHFSETDSNPDITLFYFFDLRERETFIQLTYQDLLDTGLKISVHIQIFDVSNNCNENDFFDDFTINDTHVYNMRNIQTNDEKPSGVILPNNSYGIVAVTSTSDTNPIFGNLRILDNNGYEYRTNAQSLVNSTIDLGPDDFYSINFNQEDGILFSDIVGISLERIDSSIIEWNASNPITAYHSFDVDIIDNNEIPFSCRDIIFSCVNKDSSRLQELLEFAGTASVASFEYGINNTLPHSKGSELLCPGNVTSEGVVVLRPKLQPLFGSEFPSFYGFIGLNNGNGRGSMDSFWQPPNPLFSF